MTQITRLSMMTRNDTKNLTAGADRADAPAFGAVKQALGRNARLSCTQYLSMIQFQDVTSQKDIKSYREG
jgi:hypothetical protein